MSTPDDGGPDYPQHGWTKDPETLKRMKESGQGMSLRAWFAGRETLAEWDSNDAIPSKSMCEALAGEPQPVSGWSGDCVAMLKWEAKWRAALKVIRADALLAELAKGEQK